MAGSRADAGGPAASEENSMEWFRWRGPNLNGISPETNWNPVFSADGPKELWKQKAGTGFSSISVSNGRVYTMGHGNGQETVYCFDLESGKELWKHSYPQELGDKYYEGGPSATPTIDGNAAYTLSKNGDIYCLDAASGKVIWSKNLSRELSAEIPTWGYGSSVLIQGNLAIVNVGTFGTALDKNNGAIVWKTGKDASGYATPVPFQQAGERCVAIFAASYLVGLKAADGSMVWRHPWKTDYDVNTADPIISGNTAFISSGYGTGSALIQFDGKKATTVWKNKAIQNHVNNCVLVGDYLYGIDGMAGGRKAALKCIDVKTGDIKWSERIRETGSLIAGGNRLIVLAGRGELIIAEADSVAFKEVSRAQVIGGKCWTAPAISNGRILCRNSQGTVVCLDVRK